MADGRMMTHASASEVNMDLLARLAEEIGTPAVQVAAIRDANTARHVLELCQEYGLNDMPNLICSRAREVCERFARHPLDIRVTMVDFHGAVLGTHLQQKDTGT